MYYKIVNMLSFKKFLLQEELTVGKHNDGASSGVGAFLPTTWTGTEGMPSHLPRFAGTDLIYKDLPHQTIEGKIIQAVPGRERWKVMIDTAQGTKTVDLYHDALKRWIHGYDERQGEEGLVKKHIKLYCQGHDPHGNLVIKYGEIN